LKADDIKVTAAFALGAGAPALNTFLGGAESLFKVLLMLGQFGVAVITIVYIAQKIRNGRKK
jgi:hypothetical protein